MREPSCGDDAKAVGSLMAVPLSNSWHRTSGSVWSRVRTQDTYITWKQYQANQQRLLENAKAHGDDRRQSPPREGPALLQGLLLCRRCGDRMNVRYSMRDGGQQVPTYLCDRDHTRAGARTCQSIPGASLDEAIATLLVEMV